MTCRTVGKPWLRAENNGNHFQDVILSPGDKTRIDFHSLIGKQSNTGGQVCLKFLYIKYGKDCSSVASQLEQCIELPGS